MSFKAICFDAAGTLIYLSRSVGEHYRDVAARFGESLDADHLNHAFKHAWSAAPVRPAGAGAHEDDDKGWWRALVFAVLDETLGPEQSKRFDRIAYFEAVYTHFSLPGVWQAFDDARPALAALCDRGFALALISNFDRRLYPILEGLGLREFFDAVVISSEVGADKPDPAIFQTALKKLGVAAHEAMHVGDDPKKDWGAEAVGLKVFRLERPQRGLDQLVKNLDADAPA